MNSIVLTGFELHFRYLVFKDVRRKNITPRCTSYLTRSFFSLMVFSRHRVPSTSPSTRSSVFFSTHRNRIFTHPRLCRFQSFCSELQPNVSLKSTFHTKLLHRRPSCISESSCLSSVCGFFFINRFSKIYKKPNRTALIICLMR